MRLVLCCGDTGDGDGKRRKGATTGTVVGPGSPDWRHHVPDAEPVIGSTGTTRVRSCSATGGVVSPGSPDWQHHTTGSVAWTTGLRYPRAASGRQVQPGGALGGHDALPALDLIEIDVLQPGVQDAA